MDFVHGKGKRGREIKHCEKKIEHGMSWPSNSSIIKTNHLLKETNSRHSKQKKKASLSLHNLKVSYSSRYCFLCFDSFFVNFFFVYSFACVFSFRTKQAFWLFLECSKEFIYFHVRFKWTNRQRTSFRWDDLLCDGHSSYFRINYFLRVIVKVKDFQSLRIGNFEAFGCKFLWQPGWSISIMRIWKEI